MYTLAQFRGAGELGAGSFGTVRRVVHEETGEVFAMKVLEKERVVQRDLQEQLKREVLTQLRVKHANVVRLHYYFEDAARIYCLLEYADGGQLFAYLRNQPSGVPEPRAAQLFSDTASGLAYLHSLRIVHRDLKPENILLFGAASRAKIGDFGWCVELTPEAPTRRTFCGTLDYLAPEMLMNSPHDTTVDLWALGVLLFEMLLAHAPFAGSSQKETMDRICAVRFDLPKGSMSAGPEELIRGLLVSHGRSRMPLSKVLQHPWLVAEAQAAQRGTGADDSLLLDVTKAAPRRGAAADDARRAGAAAFADDLLEATRRAPRRGATVGEERLAGGGGGDDAHLLDRTVTVQRRQAQAATVAATASSGSGGTAVVEATAGTPGLLDQTRVVPRRRPGEAAAASTSLSPEKWSPGCSSTASGGGSLDDTDPNMPPLEAAVPKPFPFASKTQSTPEGARRPSLLTDGKLQSNTEDDARIELEDLDGRFLGGGSEGDPVFRRASKGAPEADFWVVRTEQVVSSNPRPKVRSRRGMRVMEV